MGRKASHYLNWILERYTNGYFSTSVRGVPYLTVMVGNMEIGIAYFQRSDKFRLFPQEGNKFDIATKEEVVEYLNGGQ